MKSIFAKKNLVLFGVIALIVFLLASIFLLTFFEPYPFKYDEEILDVSEIYEISPALIASVINAESGFDKDAKSNRGAVGLMQILPTTAEWLCGKMSTKYYDGILKNPYLNIKIGSYYLRYLFDKFTDTNAVLASYNAGEGNVKLWLLSTEYSDDGQKLLSTPFAETNSYIDKVLGSMEIYEKKFTKILK